MRLRGGPHHGVQPVRRPFGVALETFSFNKRA